MGRYKLKKRESEENVFGIYGFVLENVKSVALEIFDKIKNTPLDKGGIFMVVGPERSGKSIVAMELKKNFSKDGGGRRLVFGQPEVDRIDTPHGLIYSRSGIEIKADSFANKKEIEKLFHDADVFVCDEVGFIPSDLQSYFLQELVLFVERGGWFVGLTIDYTSQGGEFIFPALLKTRANKVYRLTSLCQMCGEKADKYSQRLINGLPAGLDTPAFLPPSEDVSYEPRCDECFIVKK